MNAQLGKRMFFFFFFFLLWGGVAIAYVCVACVCVTGSDVKPKPPQQEEASPPGSIHCCRASVSVGPAGCRFIARPSTPAGRGRASRGAFRRTTVCKSGFLCNYQLLDQLLGSWLTADVVSCIQQTSECVLAATETT